MKPLGKKFPNVFEKHKSLYTSSLIGRTSFPDEIFQRSGREVFRYWDPNRSKLAAAIMKGMSQIGLKEGMSVLYLGAAHGYTASFVSDIIRSGMVFCVDPAPQVVHNLMFVCYERKNMAPILGDARDIKFLEKRVPKVDFVFQDIAQPDQPRIFIENCKAFLKPGGFGMIAVKARSIDISKRPKDIFRTVRDQLEKELTVVDFRELGPFEKDHCAYVCKTKN